MFFPIFTQDLISVVRVYGYSYHYQSYTFLAGIVVGETGREPYSCGPSQRFPVDGNREGGQSMKSFVNDEKGYETIELMEDSVLYMLERGQLYRLFEEDIHIANWGRKFAEKELLKTEERLIPLLFTTASERYRKLLRDNPELLLRLPLECLASYLGITPVSLSRIRAELR